MPRGLSVYDVRTIRRLYRKGDGIKVIADRFGKSKSVIHGVLSGATYADVDDPLGPLVIRPASRVSGRALNAIGRERIRLGLTTAEAAERLGMSLDALYNLERAHGRKPQSAMRSRLKRAGFNVGTLMAEIAAEKAAR